MPGTYIPINYLPVAIIMLISSLIGLGALVVGLLVRPRRPYAQKLYPYESGNPPIGDPRVPFNVKFYIVAMLFVVFDVEAVFLYPWAVAYGQLGIFGFVEMMLFIVVLLVGYIYVWKKGAFNWE
ncbi:MAG: NADH-quinone oxidoreductase subunit A [Nitrospira sp.]|nr:NADH-quinone oxidoreductase subunit A [bacterium]MBL7048506.1 NADH-quinone oxidoreductase subunit A [Nitrospira sp.]